MATLAQNPNSWWRAPFLKLLIIAPFINTVRYSATVFRLPHCHQAADGVELKSLVKFHGHFQLWGFTTDFDARVVPLNQKFFPPHATQFDSWFVSFSIFLVCYELKNIVPKLIKNTPRFLPPLFLRGHLDSTTSPPRDGGLISTSKPTFPSRWGMEEIKILTPCDTLPREASHALNRKRTLCLPSRKAKLEKSVCDMDTDAQSVIIIT